MPQPIQILFVEDDAHDAELVIQELRQAQFDPRWQRVETETDYVANLRRDLDLIIADFNLPQFSGLRALELLKGRGYEIPFIVISGTIGEDAAVETIKQGASDYLLKDRLGRLGSAVNQALEKSRLRREYRRSEEALRQSEERFRNFFEFGQIGMTISSPSKGLVEVNDKACEIWGYERDELMRMTWAELTHPDDLAGDLDNFNQVLAGESDGYSINKRFVRKDGRVIDAAISVKCLRREDGAVDRFLALLEDITERKQAEKMLRESERQQRQLAAELEAERVRLVTAQAVAKVGSWETDLSTLEVIWSPETYHIFETTPELFRPSHPGFLQFVHPEDRDPVDRAFFESFDKPSACLVSHRIFTPDGRMKFVEERWRVFRDEQGKPVRALGTCQDITDRVRGEEEARRLTRQLQLLLESAGEGIYGMDTEGLCTFMNRAACAMLGHSADQVLGRNMHDLVHHHHEDGSVYPAEECPIFRAVQQNEQCRLDKEVFWRADGTAFPVEYSSYPIIENGATTGAVITFTNITDRRRNEEQIAEQAALLDKAQDAILVRDLNGKILFWNNGAERMYGWSNEEIVGRNIGEILYREPEKFEDINRLILDHGEWSGEVQHLTRAQAEVSVQARSTLMRDKHGHPKSVLAINTDITEKKRIEAQFMRAQRMESIGTLAGGIAHDLNNILAPIMMSIDILKDLVSHPQALRILETIEVSSKRGADIVRQVLSFARGIEGERIEVQPGHLLKDIQTIVGDTFPKNIRLGLSLPNEAWTIRGDPTQLHQILLNLCVNARDAMPEGGRLDITVENTLLDEQYASMHIQAKAGRYVTISVTDSGMGIPPAVLDKIFEPFFTTKEVGKGTGLGLSTVMAIVKSHDGFVNVYSEPGKGTTFKIYLPATEPSSETGKAPVALAGFPRGNGETILVVDDEASILTITSQTLEAYGYRTLTANDGADAVATYAQHRDDVSAVLTDMAMPIMDGPATIRALTRINPAVKIIAASGLKTNGSITQVPHAGIKHFLNKPYTAETLLKTLRLMLDEVQSPG